MLHGRQLLGPYPGDLGRGQQSRTSPQGGRIAALGVPLAGGQGQPPLDGAAGGVLHQPLPQAWPFPEQCLVGDLDVSGRDGQQARVGQRGLDLGQVGQVEGQELGSGHPSSGDAVPVARTGEAEEQDARGVAGVVRQRRDGVLGDLGDGAVEATHRDVRTERQQPPLAPLPQPGQARRHEWQQPRLRPGVGDHGVGQSLGEQEPSAPGRLLDDPTYLRGAQRADQEGVVRQRSGEPGLVREAGEVVTANGQDDTHRGAFVGGQLAEDGQERRPLGLVGARRPDLFELVDDQHRLRAVGGLALGAQDQAAQQIADVDGPLSEGLPGELPQRVLAGAHDEPGPRGTSGDDVVRERGQQPSPYQ